MNHRIFVFSLLTVAISACSSHDSAKRANGDFDYSKSSEVKPLVIPKGLEKPHYSHEYQLTNNINQQGAVGDKLDVRAPALVLPVAASTRVEPNSTQAKIWFDKVLEDENLAQFIIAAVKAKLAEDNVELTTVDEKHHVFTSSWVNKTKESGFWLWSETSTVESMRFQFTLDVKPHGRSVALTVKLIDYKSANGDKHIDAIEQQRVEVAMLNNIVGYVDYLYRKHQRENRLMRATQKIVAIGENSQGESAYLIELEKDYLWSNLPSFFEKYGFTIEDLNETKNIYYVSFEKPEISLWDSIWGDGAPVIELPNAKYQFKVQAKDNESILTIYNENGEPLSAQTLNKIFPVMEPGLSFREAN